MISIYKIKPAFQKLLTPLMKILRSLKITPNAITLFSILFSFLLCYFFIQALEHKIFFLFVAIGLLIRMMLNALDGMMARTYNLQSKFGEALNEIGDIISDTAIYFPIIFLPEIKIEIAIIFIILSIINEFCGLLAKTLSNIRRYDGPMGKSDRAFLIGTLCIIYYFTNDISHYLNYIFGCACFLIMISSYLRISKSI